MANNITLMKQELAIYSASIEKANLLGQWSRTSKALSSENLFIDASLEQPFETITDTLEQIIEACRDYPQGLIDLLSFMQDETLCKSHHDIKQVIEKFRLALHQSGTGVTINFPQLQADFKCLFFYLRASNWELQRLYQDCIRLSNTEILEANPSEFSALIRSVTADEINKVQAILALQLS